MHNAHTHVKIKFYSLVCHFLPVEVRTYNYTIHHSPKATRFDRIDQANLLGKPSLPSR